MKLGLAIGLSVGSVFCGIASAQCQASKHETSAMMGMMSGDIVETAVAAGEFKTLAAAIQAAGLAETLKGKGPFTVFAPTDAAFAKLPKGTLESLLRPENKAKLASILAYHVVPGRVFADQAMGLTSAKSAQGGTITLKAAGGKLMVDNATVTATDVEARNGVIHVIDTVIMPK